MAKSFDRNSYRNRRPQGAQSFSRQNNASPNSCYRSAVDDVRRRGSSSRRPSVSGANGAGSGGAGGAGQNPYARSAYRPDYSKQRKSRKRRKILLVSLVVVLVLIVGAGGTAFAYLAGIQGNFQNNVSDEMREILVDRVEPGDPFYMVLMGTDGSAERAEQDEFQGDNFRTDSIMLARIDPKQKQASIVSLMRDTQVDMGEYGLQKLNAAHAIGGPEYAVEVVSDLAGVPIAHYAEINFDGFKEIVDAVGGIDVNVPMKIDDPEAGGYVAAGQQTLNGEQALILCRSRHTYDDIEGVKGDEMRAANQRLVISAIAKKVLETGDVTTMLGTVEAMSKSVTTDMGLMDLLSLANNMRGMDMDTSFYTAVNPTTSEYIDDIWWEIMDETEWRKMMRRIDQGLPPTETDEVNEATGIVTASAGGGAAAAQATAEPKVVRSGTVSIRNGTEVNGAGAAAQEKVDALGYTTDVGNANSTDYAQTLVIYETADQAERAQEIVDALGVGTAVQNNNEYLFSTDFLVVIGSDWS